MVQLQDKDRNKTQTEACNLHGNNIRTNNTLGGGINISQKQFLMGTQKMPSEVIYMD